MKSNWTQILVFTILALVLGFILGRVTGHHGKRGHHRHGKTAHHHMEKRIVVKDGKADMEWHDQGSHGKIYNGEDEVQVVVESLENADFFGDTTITIDGGEIRVKRNSEEMEVQVEIESEESR